MQPSATDNRRTTSPLAQWTMSVARLTALLGLALLLAGCTSAFERELNKIADSLENDSPSFAQVWERLDEANELHWRHCNRPSFTLPVGTNVCETPDALQARSGMTSAAYAHLTSLIEAEDKATLLGVFDRRFTSRFINRDALRVTATEKLLEISGRDTAHPDILYTAAQQANAGRHVVQDSLTATRLFQRAWEAGNANAADALAASHAGAQDHYNAYLWSLRCTTPCTKSFSLATLMAQLDHREILAVQALARDPTVLEVNPPDIQGIRPL